MKKFLKYTLIILILLAAGFFSIGLLKPSFTYETRTMIHQPVDTVFADFTNSMKILKWIPGLEGIAWISGNQNEPGSRWMFVMKINGRKYEMTQTLKTFKVNQEFSFNTQCNMFSNDVTVAFVPQGQNTEVVSTSRMTGLNLFWRAGLFLNQSFLKEQDQKMYDQFKGMVESDH